MTGAIKLITGLIFVAVFAFAIINYSFGFANDNNAAVNLSSDSQFSDLESTIQTDLSTGRQNIENSKTGIFNSSIDADGETLRTPGVFTLLWGGLKNTMTTISQTVNTRIFGGSPAFGAVTTIFMALLVFLIAMAVWKLWRQGSPD